MSSHTEHAMLTPSDGVETRDFPEREKYTTTARLEINQIMHALKRGATLITASLDNEEFKTSVVAIDERAHAVMLDCARHATQNDRVLSMDRLVCNSYLDRVRIRFECTDMEATTYEGREVIKTSMPKQLLRLQRREYYRMPTPLHAPVKCVLFAAPTTITKPFELTVVDISCGGVGVVTAAEMFTPKLGDRYGCSIDLPGMGTVAGEVQVRNTFTVKLPDRTATARSGLAFMRLPENMVATIQRYNMNLERQQARLSR